MARWGSRLPGLPGWLSINQYCPLPLIGPASRRGRASSRHRDAVCPLASCCRHAGPRTCLKKRQDARDVSQDGSDPAGPAMDANKVAEVLCGGGNAAGCDSRLSHRTIASHCCRGGQSGREREHHLRRIPPLKRIQKLCTTNTRSTILAYA